MRTYQAIRKALMLVLFWLTGSFCVFADNWQTSVPPETLMLDQPLLELLSRSFDAKLASFPAPFARRLRMLETGEIDLMAGLLKRPERETFAYFLNPPYKFKSNKYFFVRKGEISRIRKYEDLYGLKVGVSINAKTFPRFDQDSAIEKVQVSYLAQKFKMLVLDRIDTFVHTDVEAIAQMRELGLENHVDIAEFRYTRINPVHIGISRRSPLMEKLDAIEKEYRRMAISGELDRFIIDFFQSRELPVPDYK